MSSILEAGSVSASDIIAAIRGGNVELLIAILDATPHLARARIVDASGTQRTLLHIAADWPGFIPNTTAIVRALVAAGADPNAPVGGTFHSETALHWAASNDDTEMAEVLLECGADCEAMGASIAGGTPLDDAVGYGCWNVARLLVARGARMRKLWHAAALGMMSELEQQLAGLPRPASDEINNAFWQACHGGQRRAAMLLVKHGAEVTWVPDYARQTPRGVAASIDTGRQSLLNWLDSVTPVC